MPEAAVQPSPSRIRLLLRSEEEESQEEVAAERSSEEAQPLHVEFREGHWAPPEEPVRSVTLGPFELSVDLNQVKSIVDAVRFAKKATFELVAGPKLTHVAYELSKGNREPKDRLERLLLRIVRGPSRFDKVLDDV